FTVSDIYEKSDKEKDYVFFDWASPDYSDKPPESALDSKEKQKIFNRKKEADLNKIPVNQIKLIGFASEEGNVNYNKQLIKRRLQAVENVLKKEAGYQGPVQTEERFSASKGKLDYRYWRAVEIRFNNETSTRDEQEKDHIVCPMEKQTVVEKYRQKAFDMMNNPTKGAMPQLKRYIAEPDPNSTVAAKLDYLFGGNHSKETAIKVLNRINAIDIFLKEISYQTNIRCGLDQTPSCKAGSSAATNPKKKIIRLCPIFFSKERKELAPGTLIHEASHASVYRIIDMAYRNYRAMRILTTEQALDNADSLEEFIYHVYGVGTKVGPKKADKLSGCEKYKDSIDKTAAVAEHRNTYAKHGTAQTYRNPDNLNYMRYYLYKRFHRADKPAVAGIFDRYMRMFKHLKKQLSINCLQPDNKLCKTGTIVHWPNTRTVNICISPFMKITPNKRIEHFHAGLARHMPGVTRKQSYAYPKLALDYWRHFWGNDGVKPRKPVDILHEDHYTTKDYKKTVEEWPEDKPIWPYLTQKDAKLNYVRYIVNIDLTNCRRGTCKDFARSNEAFENACQGFATQMAVRYSTFTHLSEEEIENLKTIGKIYEDNTPAKYQIPLYMAVVPGHAFNAVLLGENTDNIDDYIFLEPQNDKLFYAGDAEFNSNFKMGILSIKRFTGYNKITVTNKQGESTEQGQYLNTDVTNFIKGNKDAPVNVTMTNVEVGAYTSIVMDIFIADRIDSWNTSVKEKGLTYEEYITKRVGEYNISDDNMAMVGGYIIGRQFRRSPEAEEETLTKSIYIELIGRPSLEELIPDGED
ncbi:MAG: hypothetical protein GY757_55480, partial [bacterium]|nr:hypothetical protein [bacterium]